MRACHAIGVFSARIARTTAIRRGDGFASGRSEQRGDQATEKAPACRLRGDGADEIVEAVTVHAPPSPNSWAISAKLGYHGHPNMVNTPCQ
jgi:hypothetical protein